MGKPKKKSDEKHQELLGRKVLCISMGGALYQCQNPKCMRVKKKGMFVEYQNNIFCGERCIRSYIGKEE